MPILSMIPTTENVFGGLPRIAKLRKGAPKEQRKRKDGSTYEVVGRDLDHLRVSFDPEYEHLQPVFTKLYGKEPKEFAAFLNADTVHEAFDFWNEEWTATTMLRRCDGQHKHVWYNEQTGFYQNAKVLCDAKGGGKCGCKAVGRLNVILPEFTMETGVIGYFTIETHSEEDIRTLYARITSIWATFGKLRGVPLVFYRVPRKTSTPDVEKNGTRTGKRRNLTRHMLDCRVEPEYTKQHFLTALTGMREQLPPPPVSTLPAVSTQRSVALLNGSNARITAPVVLKPQVDTVTGEVLSAGNGHTPEPEEPEITPPEWYTEPRKGYLLGRLKEKSLIPETFTWADLLTRLGWQDVECYMFETSDAMGHKIAPLLEAKKLEAGEAKPNPTSPVIAGNVTAASDKNAIPANVLAQIDASIEDIPTTATNPNWKKRPAEQPAAGGD